MTEILDPKIHRATQADIGLRKLFSQCMPPEVLDQILFARIAEETLRITTGNSAWAARIRFHSRELIRLAQSRHPTVSRVSVHVLPRSVPIVCRRQSTRRKPYATSNTASRIRQVADDVEQDELRAALHRLAAHLSGDQPG